MRRLGLLTGIASTALLASYAAQAAPVLRTQVDQHGDMVIIGNSLAQDCVAGTVAPVAAADSAGLSPEPSSTTRISYSHPDPRMMPWTAPTCSATWAPSSRAARIARRWLSKQPRNPTLANPPA